MELTGKIITEPEAEPFSGRVIVKLSRIVAVEPQAGNAQKPDEPFIVPGFIDAHTHPLELGLVETFANLERCKAVDEVLARVRDRLADGAESGVMMGFNLEPDGLAEKRYPLLSELDLVSPEVPILLYRVDGHSAVLNSAGLRLTLKEEHMPGIEKDAQGRPTGILHGPAYEQASRIFKSQLEPATILHALGSAGQLAARAGVTTIAALVGSDELNPADWLLLLRCLDRLPVRAVPFLQTRKPELAKRFRMPRVGGCLLIDGSFGSHTAALSEPYSDVADNRGTCYFSDEELSAIIKKAESLKLQTAFHAIGDRAVEQLVRCHERLRTNRDLRHRIEHAELLLAPQSHSLVARIAALGLVLGVQPAFETRWGGPDKLYARRLGERWRCTNPYRSLLDAGIVLAGGSDAPITPIDPIAGIRAAIEHPNHSQRISGTEALAMFTTNAAYSLGLESVTGRIEPGLEADLVVLDADPRNTEVSRVLATYRAGVCIFEKGQP